MIHTKPFPLSGYPSSMASGPTVLSTARGLPTYNTSRRRIVIIDNMPDTTIALEDSLAKKYEVIAFNDPEYLLSSFRAGMYDMAIVDYLMPKMNGLELCRILRRVDPKMKTLLVTAYDISIILKHETGREYSELENLVASNSILRKPFTKDELAAKIAFLFGESSVSLLPARSACK
jgi:DNA-binding response OmpR family regulator